MRGRLDVRSTILRQRLVARVQPPEERRPNPYDATSSLARPLGATIGLEYRPIVDVWLPTTFAAAKQIAWHFGQIGPRSPS